MQKQWNFKYDGNAPTEALHVRVCGISQSLSKQFFYPSQLALYDCLFWFIPFRGDVPLPLVGVHVVPGVPGVKPLWRAKFFPTSLTHVCVQTNKWKVPLIQVFLEVQTHQQEILHTLYRWNPRFVVKIITTYDLFSIG